MCPLLIRKTLSYSAGFFTLGSALPIVSIIALTSLGLWLSNADQVSRVVMPKDISQPLFIMQDFSSAFMDENGLKTGSISAHYLQHYEGDNIQMQSPIVNLAINEGDTWFAQSDYATLNQSNVMLLTGNVIIKRTSERQILAMKTDRLSYNFEQKIGATKSSVSLQGQGLFISSTGMSFDLNSATIELNSNVKGRYEPQNL